MSFSFKLIYYWIILTNSNWKLETEEIDEKRNIIVKKVIQNRIIKKSPNEREKRDMTPGYTWTFSNERNNPFNTPADRNNTLQNTSLSAHIWKLKRR